MTDRINGLSVCVCDHTHTHTIYSMCVCGHVEHWNTEATTASGRDRGEKRKKMLELLK